MMNADTTPDAARPLDELIARKLCQLTGRDPDARYYPVNTSHRDIYWPMWQVFRDDAREIIAVVQAGKRAA